MWDAGLSTISRADQFRTWEPIVEYKEIIQKFLSDHPMGLDLVFVVSAREWHGTSIFSNAFSPSRRLYWAIEPFSHTGEYDLSGLHKAFASLPAPRFVPIAARERLRAGWFRPGGADQYRNLEFRGGQNLPNELRFSARALADFVSGRLSENEFREQTGLEGAQLDLEAFVGRGRTLTNIRFEPGGLDSDDDTVVLEFDFDFAVAPFKRD
jgi:hypothetical protein